MLQQLRCPRCGKRMLDLETESVVETVCRYCKNKIRYDKGVITIIGVNYCGRTIDTNMIKDDMYLTPEEKQRIISGK